MKPNVVTVTTNPVSSPLTTALPTAKIVSLPRVKMDSKTEAEGPTLTPPDEETLKRLNKLAKQHPFCILHRGSNSPLL
jgi:hypothetical protein